MDIVYGIPGSGIGGGINVVLEHASRLAQRGHNVIVLNLLGELDTSWNPIYRFTALSRFNRSHLKYIRSLQLDLVVATGWQTVYEIAKLNLNAKAFAYFLQADEVEFNPIGSVDRELANYTRSLNFRYLSCASWLGRLVPNFECVPIVNGLNHRYFYPDIPLIPKANRLRVLIEGPISQPRKRIDDAFVACLPLRSKIDLWCVSSGGELVDWYKPDLYLSRVPMNGMRHVYSSCDVILKLSSAEGMFGPPLEMMACGGTAITSNCDGHEEYMKDGINGLVVEVGDVAGARSALNRLLSDPVLLESLKDAAQDTAKNFQWEPKVDILETTFLKWIQSTPAMTLTKFLSVRGTPFDKNLLSLYNRVSYGSLPAPVSPSYGRIVSVQAKQKHSQRWLRLKGWVALDRPQGSETVLSCSFNDQKSSNFLNCNIERPDIAAGYGEQMLLSGFDFVFPTDWCSDVGGNIDLEIRVGYKFTDSPEPVFVGKLSNVLASSVSHLVNLQCAEVDAVPGPNVSGILESAESFTGYEVSIPETLIADKGVSFSIFCSTSEAGQYVFYQPYNERFFLNTGFWVPAALNDEAMVFDFDATEGPDSSIIHLVLLSTSAINLDCVRARVI